MHSKFLLALLATILACSGCAVSRPAAVNGQAVQNQVVLENSRIFTYHSAITDHTYRLKTVVPGNYDGQDSARTYPLIIKLDGQWDFPLVFGAYNCVAFDGQMPQAIVVGIDWGDVEGDIHEIRSRDLMPTPLPQYPDSGRADNFLRALTDEIVPELEKRYRLSGERVLVGGSTSAVFATYALLEKPAFFSGAVAIAGGYGDAQAILDQQLQALDGTGALAGKRLYMGVGSLDEVAPQVVALARSVEKSDLKGFEMRLHQLEGFGHSGMNIPGYAAGFQHIFRRPALNLPPSTLKQYVGRFKPATDGSEQDGPELKVTQSTAGLQLAFPGGAPLLLAAKSEEEFYHPGMWLKLRFDGHQLHVDTPSGQQQFVRVDSN